MYLWIMYISFSYLFFFPAWNLSYIFSATPSLFLYIVKEKHICFSLVFLLDSFTKMKNFRPRCNRGIKPSCMRVYFIRWFGIFFIWSFCLHFFEFRLNSCIYFRRPFLLDFILKNKTFENRTRIYFHICGISQRPIDISDRPD